MPMPHAHSNDNFVTVISSFIDSILRKVASREGGSSGGGGGGEENAVCTACRTHTYITHTRPHMPAKCSKTLDPIVQEIFLSFNYVWWNVEVCLFACFSPTSNDHRGVHRLKMYNKFILTCGCRARMAFVSDFSWHR